MKSICGKERRITLREVMEKEPLFAPCVYDCLSATIIEETGFKGMCLSGASVAASYVGVPDIGLVSFGELLDVVFRVTAYTNIPMIVDIDTGFGNEINVIRTCENIARAGAMAVHMEDQIYPKRCGHLRGKEVIPREDYFKKVRAAAYALRGTDCMLIARTDCFQQYGCDEAIARNLGSLEAGADISFTEGPESIADIERIAREVPGWKMFDMCVKGASPDISFDALCEMGYRLVTAPLISIGGAQYGIQKFADFAMRDKNDLFAKDGEYNAGPMHLFNLMGIKEWLELGKTFNENINIASRQMPK